MTLISQEQDEEEVMRAEDEAIRALEQNIQPEPVGQKATGVPKLIEEAFSETAVHGTGES